MLCVSIIVSAALAFILAFDSDEPKSLALIAILGMTSFCMILSMILKFSLRSILNNASNYDELVHVKGTIELLLKPSNVKMILFHASTIAMTLIFITRLIATDHFGGDFFNLDFGKKVTDGKAKGQNYAMEPGLNTLAHFMQGFLSCLLSYPVVSGLIAKLCGRQNRDHSGIISKVPNLSVLLFLQSLSACCTIYPTYSMIKRWLKDAESFSRTSMMNNVTEWILGYILANGIGWLISALIEMKLLKDASMDDRGRDDDMKDTEVMDDSDAVDDSNVLDKLRVDDRYIDIYGFGKSSELVLDGRGCGHKIVVGLSTLLLILLSVTTVLTGYLIGNTWNFNDKAKAKEEVIWTNVEVMILFAGYYVSVFLLMSIISVDPKDKK